MLAVLLLFLALLLFLLLGYVDLVGIVVLEGFVEGVVMRGRGENVANGELRLLALMRLAIPGALVVLIGREDLLQPRHQLIDRRQRARRPLLARQTLLAARPLRTLGAGRPLWSRLAGRPGLAARALRTGLALRTCLAVEARLAALTIRPAPSRLPLGAPWTRRALQAASGRILCHYRNSATHL